MTLAPDPSAQQQMQALAYLYDNLREFPTWFQRLTPLQMQHLAALLSRWQRNDQESPAIRPLDEMEQREFTRALIAFNGDVCAAAKALGIGKTTFYRRLKEWGFTAEDWRRVYQAAALAHAFQTNASQRESAQDNRELLTSGKMGA